MTVSSTRTARLVIVSALFGLIASAQATVKYVDGAGGNDGNSGDSWGSAWKSLTYALASTSTGAEIWVKGGTTADFTYTPGSTSTDKFTVSSRLVYGHFAGSETDISQRLLTNSNYTSILSSGGTGDNRCNHVVVMSGTSTVDGFTITNGYAHDTGQQSGGGISANSGSTSTIENCIITGNSALNKGGGLLAYQTSWLKINACTFDSNTALGGGGAYIEGGSSGGCTLNGQSVPCVTGCIFDSNHASAATSGQGAQGGGLYIRLVDLYVTGCIFRSNVAEDVSSPALDLTVLGAGMFVNNCEPTIVTSDFVDNHATTTGTAHVAGGGILADVDGEFGGESDDLMQITIKECHFVGNAATEGGGIWLSGADTDVAGDWPGSGAGQNPGRSKIVDPTILFCDFVNNVCDDGGTGAAMWTKIVNGSILGCRFIGNQAPPNPSAWRCGLNPHVGAAYYGYRGIGCYAGECSKDSERHATLTTIADCVYTGNFMNSQVFTSGCGECDENGHGEGCEDDTPCCDEWEREGAAIFLFNNSNTKLVNCVVARNSAAGDIGEVGGVYVDSCTAAIDNCILWDNQDLSDETDQQAEQAKMRTENTCTTYMVVRNSSVQDTEDDGTFSQTGYSSTAGVFDCNDDGTIVTANNTDDHPRFKYTVARKWSSASSYSGAPWNQTTYNDSSINFYGLGVAGKYLRIDTVDPAAYKIVSTGPISWPGLVTHQLKVNGNHPASSGRSYEIYDLSGDWTISGSSYNGDTGVTTMTIAGTPLGGANVAGMCFHPHLTTQSVHTLIKSVSASTNTTLEVWGDWHALSGEMPCAVYCYQLDGTNSPTSIRHGGSHALVPADALDVDCDADDDEELPALSGTDTTDCEDRMTDRGEDCEMGAYKAP